MKNQIIEKDFGNIMILVPHQDDEILMCAGIMESAREKGLKVTVVMVTNGDYGSQNLEIGRTRLKETLEGIKVLGFGEENLVFLGYADTGMPEKDSFLYQLYQEKEEDREYKSHCSSCTYGLLEKEEFHFIKYGEHGSYTRRNCYQDIKEVIKEYHPERIFTTSEEDIHGDHKGLFLFVRDILDQLKGEGYTPTLYSGVVHSKAGDENWPLRTKSLEALSCPEDFEKTGKLRWDERISFPVPDNSLKEKALAKHITALKPDAVEFLYSFLKKDEIFWERKGC
ncbi:MAG: PIG-L family deacetylase [Acetivibrio sp.]